MAHYQLTDEEFIEKYKPVKNPFEDRCGAWDDCAFETYGEELEYVKKVLTEKPNHVWTIMDSDGFLFVGEGFHFVNRMNYLITEVPYQDGDTFDIMDADDRAEMENPSEDDDE